MDQITADTGNAVAKLDKWVDGFFRLVPNLVVALVLLILFWLLSRAAASLIRRTATRRGRVNLGDVGASLLRWMVMILGTMLAVTVVAPSISPADLFGFLGIGSVAIGFAFKDILQNMLAGILILIRQPFEVGDQIRVSGDHEGTVERIETRATLIRTYDNRRVVIPNSDIYTDSVVVMTAFETARSQYDILIGCGDDIDRARGIMCETVATVEGVLADPAPDAIPWGMEADGTLIRLRWWTKSDRASTVRIRGDVIRDVYEALVGAGIDLPFPTRMILFHDQTEATDGDRARQREGWPAGAGPVPAPRPVAAGGAKTG